MRRSAVRQLLRDERHDLSRFLTHLPPEQWDARTPCAEWTVRHVAAHLASFVGVTRRGLLARNLRYGSGTDAANARSAAAWAAKHPDRIVTDLDDPKRLGLGFIYPKWALCETVVHHQDIRHAVQQPRDVPEDRLRVALAVLLRLPFITKAKRRTRKVTLHANDINWSHGNGPDVHGPAEALLMALAGRSSAAPDLRGPGTNTLLPTT